MKHTEKQKRKRMGKKNPELSSWDSKADNEPTSLDPDPTLTEMIQ